MLKIVFGSFLFLLPIGIMMKIMSKTIGWKETLLMWAAGLLSSLMICMGVYLIYNA